MNYSLGITINTQKCPLDLDLAGSCSDPLIMIY